MSKTAFKAFVYSFSVSLFAILAANRAFWHEKNTSIEPLHIDHKNIALFLKEQKTAALPVKKIALNVLPEIKNASLPTPRQETDVVLAQTAEDFEFPVEVELAPQKPVAVALADPAPKIDADILYAPDKPEIDEPIEAAPIYAPESEVKVTIQAPKLAPPKPVPTPKKAEKSKPAVQKQAPIMEDNATKQARLSAEPLIPIQRTGGTASQVTKVTLGDPKDLNHVAMTEKNIPIQSVQKQAESRSTEKVQNKEWQSMSDSPWAVAESGGVPKNRFMDKKAKTSLNAEAAQVLDASPKGGGVQVASDTVKNLIIPIPDKIMEEENLTPKLAYPSTSEDAAKEKEIEEQLRAQNEEENTKTKLLSPIAEDESILSKLPKKDKPAPKAQNVTADKDGGAKNGFLQKINSIFAPSEKTVEDNKAKAIARAQAKRSLKQRAARSRPVSIMPTEMKLSFQPNRAEISGQTLRWVQAFATHSAETPDTMLEVRIDGSATTLLQQRRLNLLYNILINKGVSYSQINTVFTTREPNSFILRMINAGEDDQTTKKKNRQSRQNRYIQW